MPVRRYWLVEGRDGLEPRFFACAYPLHWYSEQQMSVLLQALAAKSSLSYSEIAGALKRKNKRTSHLEVSRLDNRIDKPFTLACGPSLDWTARVLSESDSRLDGLKIV